MWSFKQALSSKTLHELVFKWSQQHHSHGIAGFSASSGWLYRFSKWHNIIKKIIYDKGLNSDVVATKPLTKTLDNLIQNVFS